MKNNFVGNEVVETPPFEPNSNVQPLHQSPIKTTTFHNGSFYQHSVLCYTNLLIPIINDLFNFVAVVGLAPLHDGYEPCMRLSHLYRDFEKGYFVSQRFTLTKLNF